jgi:glutamate synthase domain-containing protein 3
MELVELETVEAEEDIQELRDLISEHYQRTESTVADRILSDWDNALAQFIKVMPRDYKRVIEERKAQAASASHSDKKTSESKMKVKSNG